MSENFRLGHVLALDGMRGLAVIAVILYHSGFLPGGYLGVDVFFVLSGFLITSLLLTEWQDTRAISLRRFYLRRVLRLLPALLAVLLACYLFEIFYMRVPAGPSIERRILYAMSYAANWVQIYLGKDGLTTLSVVWSLAIEEQFYLFWPIALKWLLNRRLSLGRIALFVLAGIVAVTCRRFYLYSLGADYFRLLYGTDTHIDTVLTGCLLALMVSNRPQIVDRFGFWVGPLFLAGLVLTAIFIWSDSSLFTVCMAYTSAAVFSSAAILGSLRSRSWIRFILESKILVWFGKLSYGIYLWQGTSAIYLYHYFGTSFVPRTMIGLGLAVISYYWLERPCLTLKDRLPRAVSGKQVLAESALAVETVK